VYYSITIMTNSQSSLDITEIISSFQRRADTSRGEELR
jgi:hypothetical protein